MRKFTVIALACVGVGCYHATIETGAPPSAQTISKSFASGWIYGLVPPSTVQTAEKCPNGVAKIETQLSFVNQLVSFFTFGIYTPMDIEVTCAEKQHVATTASHDLSVSENEGPNAVRAAFDKAAERAIASNAPVYVEIHR